MIPATRTTWIERMPTLAVQRQCDLGVSRAAWYAQQAPQAPNAPKAASEPEDRLCRLIDEEYTRHPFYGSRRMRAYLSTQGHCVNRKRVQRLMKKLGLEGMAPGPNTSKGHPQHKIWPYLLRGCEISRPNQVWSADITYIRLGCGFVYLVAVIDWYSRRVLSWRLSNTMDATFCVDCLEEALAAHGTPEIFNSDQGAQFTSAAFTDVLLKKQVQISMDGRGRALDNIFVERLWRSVKYEEIYLKGHATISELLLGLTQYFAFYNNERPHQSLRDQTPNAVYRQATGGGARIPDHPPEYFRNRRERLTKSGAATRNNRPDDTLKTKQPCTAAFDAKTTA